MKELTVSFYINKLSELENTLLTIEDLPITLEQCEMIHIEPSKSIINIYFVRVIYRS